MKKELKIKFKNETQFTAFLNWLNNYGFDMFLESDSVQDDIPYKGFPTELIYSSGNTKETTIIIK